MNSFLRRRIMVPAVCLGILFCSFTNAADFTSESWESYEGKEELEYTFVGDDSDLIAQSQKNVFVSVAEDSLENEFVDETSTALVGTDTISFSDDNYDYVIKNGKAVIEKFRGEITDVSIPSSVTYNGTQYSIVEIESKAFVCPTLVKVTVPESIQALGDYAFYNCVSLRTMVFHNPGTILGYNSLGYYSGDKDLPERVSHLEIIVTSDDYRQAPENNFLEYAAKNHFAYAYDCDGTDYYYLTEDGGYYISEELGDNYYFKDYLGADSEIHIPTHIAGTGVMGTGNVVGWDFGKLEDKERITKIFFPNENHYYSDAFNEYGLSGFTNLIHVELPVIKTIGKHAFENCSNLPEIILPEGLEKIEEYAFSGCGSLTSVTIPQSVSAISESAFEGCNTNLVIKGDRGSVAEIYAGNNGITFEAVDQEAPITETLPITTECPTTTTSEEAPTTTTTERQTTSTTREPQTTTTTMEEPTPTTSENLNDDQEDLLDQKIKLKKEVLKGPYSKNKKVSIEAKAATKITYKNTNKKVAVVNKKGIITLKGCGRCQIEIYAAQENGYKAASATVTVEVRPANLTKNNIKITSYNQCIAINFSNNDKTFTGYRIRIKKAGAKKYTVNKAYKKSLKQYMKKKLKKGVYTVEVTPYVKPTYGDTIYGKAYKKSITVK